MAAGPAGLLAAAGRIKGALTPGTMRAPYLLVFSLLTLLLSACDPEPLIEFAQPFPLSAPVLTAFSARHRGTYCPAGDTTYQLTITATVIWVEQLRTTSEQVEQPDSLKLRVARKQLNTWQVAANHTRYRFRAGKADTLWLDTWARDTLATVGGAFRAGRVRWYRGAYYISRQPFAEASYWQVERLVPNGNQLSQEALGTDTLRIAVLPAGVVRRDTAEGGPQWLLRPGTRRQERQLADYAGLWELRRELWRQ